MTEHDPNRAIGAAIEQALAALDRTQGWLGAEVAAREGRPSPFSQPTVSDWIKGIGQIPPARLFTIEAVLGRPPGSISRLGGYLPASRTPPPSVRAAIEADNDLTPDQRAMLITVYEDARKRTKGARP